MFRGGGDLLFCVACVVQLAVLGVVPHLVTHETGEEAPSRGGLLWGRGPRTPPAPGPPLTLAPGSRRLLWSLPGEGDCGGTGGGWGAALGVLRLGGLPPPSPRLQNVNSSAYRPCIGLSMPLLAVRCVRRNVLAIHQSYIHKEMHVPF